jgi:predicted ATPase
MAEFLRVRGELLFLKSTPRSTKEAEEQFLSSLNWARRQRTLSWELRTSISLARLYQGLGQTDKAQDALVPTYSRFKEGFETGDLKTAKTLISELAEFRMRPPMS